MNKHLSKGARFITDIVGLHLVICTFSPSGLLLADRELLLHMEKMSPLLLPRTSEGYAFAQVLFLYVRQIIRIYCKAYNFTAHITDVQNLVNVVGHGC